MLFLIVLGDAMYLLNTNNIIPSSSLLSVIIKGSTSALFVITGLVNMIYAVKNDTKYLKATILLFIGLVFAMAGDIMLEIVFIVGAGLFGVGHIFFFISYCFMARFKVRDLLYGLVIFLPSLAIILFVPILDYGGTTMLIVCIAYALVISLMLGKAISNYNTLHTLLSMVILIGSMLFFFSDMMLLFDIFGHIPYTNLLCLITYYPAEYILALSIYFASKEKV